MDLGDLLACSVLVAVDKTAPVKGSIESRRRQLLDCAHAVSALAESRDIRPIHVSQVSSDLELRRVLETIVRRWTKLTPALLTSPEAVGLGSPNVDLDHVVPCRALIDRMIMNPSECESVLYQGVVLARITKQQHKDLGGIFADHQALYGRLLEAPIAELPEIARGRYVAKQITLLPIS